MNLIKKKTRPRVCFILILYFMLSSVCVQAQTGNEVKITGTIIDEANIPVIGATIVLKNNPAKGTISDTDGKFILDVPKSSVIKISYLNYKTQEIAIKDQTVFNIKMVPVDQSLDAVVVIGYGAVKKRDLTGSVSSVNMNDLMKAPVKSYDDALQGKIAGVMVQGDSQPGNAANIVIRGNNSVTQSNSPLYVVDGFPMEENDNNSINPMDIASIEILKDASATAIYGARGANGVIIVTTKRGAEGTPKVTYDGYFSLQKDYNRMAVMSPYDFIKLQSELDPAMADMYLGSQGKTLDDYRNVKGIDWADMVLRTAPMHNHNISITGGTKATKYALSLSYMNQEGVIINSGFERWQGRVSMDHELSKHVKLAVSANYSDRKTTGSTINSGGGSSSFMWSVWAYRPVVANPDIDLINNTEDPEIGQGPARTNPYQQVKNEMVESHTKSLMANASLTIELMKGLNLKTTVGISDISVNNNTFNNSKTHAGSNLPGNTMGVNGQRSFSSNTTFTNENTLTYTTKFGLNKLTAMGGYTYQDNNSDGFGARGTQVPNEVLGLNGLDEAKGYNIFNAATAGWNLQSFLGRVIYSYDSRYDLTLSARVDGSSRFSKDNRWSDFYSGALAWRFSSEKFMKNIGWLNDGKLRLSYGTTGNNNVGNFSYMPQIKVTGGDGRYDYSFGNETPSLGAIVYSIGNPNLKWETTSQFNAGLDLYFLNSRINLTVDYYKKTTKDLLIYADLPAHTGYAKAYKNIGEVENHGFEFTLNTQNIQTKDFTWSSNLNISFNRNKLKALTQGQQTLITTINGSFPASGYIAKVGYPIGMFYGAVFDGLYQYDDFVKAADGTYILKSDVQSQSTAAARNNVLPGYAKYKDMNHDKIINSDDFTIIGDPNPDFIGGFTNNLQYENFDLNFFFQFSYGNEILNANRMDLEEAKNISTNQYATMANRWTVDNPNSDIPRARSSVNTNWFSSRVVEDGSYLKLKNITLGYTLPHKLVSRLKISNLRLYATVQNVFTWTDYNGSDPEVSTRYSALTPAYDSSPYPVCRTFTLGTSVTF